MGLVRSIVRPAEKSLRAKQVEQRIFWQKPSTIPTYVRGKGDSLFFGITASVITVGFAHSLYEANDLIKGKQ
ncbi:uncharacterized protein EV422DRAFT_570593 [Fimicolochytrium jonesii]|uniref:uncharacterized protein n=1 Tax=Fimicolochytrium jonesii TaxID=1396493 RepID=UPI0022FE225D|nr:uncharacterized protein EV422DRAFT_570593 [Fimicolochytrium jonesii]KAI8817546.1 hypothetical protein EV422DRAFT_570593 [Fimicolochytrium jonesii]